MKLTLEQWQPKIRKQIRQQTRKQIKQASQYTILALQEKVKENR